MMAIPFRTNLGTEHSLTGLAGMEWKECHVSCLA